MSKESVKKFMEDLAKKPELIEEINKHGGNAGSEDARLKAICDLASKKGYKFTLAELKTAMAECGNELDEGELSNVAGGAGWRDGAKSALFGAASSLLSAFANNGKITKADLKQAAFGAASAGMQGYFGEQQ